MLPFPSPGSPLPSILHLLASILGTDPLEQVAALFGIVSVWLSVKEKIWSWPTAIVNVGLYTIVFWNARLYADMGLQVVYVVLSFYGWWEWLYGGANRTELHVSRVPAREAALLAAGGVAFAAALGTFLHRTTDAALPYMDATLTSASLVAQWLMTRKRLENWALWIAADVAYVGMFIYKGLRLTAVLYAVFLVLAVLGHVEWRRSLRARREQAA